MWFSNCCCCPVKLKSYLHICAASRIQTTMYFFTKWFIWIFQQCGHELQPQFVLGHGPMFSVIPYLSPLISIVIFLLLSVDEEKEWLKNTFKRGASIHKAFNCLQRLWYTEYTDTLKASDKANKRSTLFINWLRISLSSFCSQGQEWIPTYRSHMWHPDT